MRTTWPTNFLKGEGKRNVRKAFGTPTHHTNGRPDVPSDAGYHTYNSTPPSCEGRVLTSLTALSWKQKG